MSYDILTSITTFIQKLNKHYLSTVILPVVFIFAGIAVNPVFRHDHFLADTRIVSVLGGPEHAQAVAAPYDAAILDSFPVAPVPVNEADVVEATSADLNTALMVSGTDSLRETVADRDGFILYTVKRGDNLSIIAANFGISLETVRGANPGLGVKALQPGQELVIPWVNGVIHEVSEGQALDDIAVLYGVDASKIRSANKQVITVTQGMRLMIPGGSPRQALMALANTALPSIPGYFKIPTTGKNWGKLHPTNAVDIANPCGTPIYAAAEGLVIEESSDDSWDQGYGNALLIEHPNGTKTRYAHTEENIKHVGDYVPQGEKIALMGNTGNTTGVTGCHLHFEVYGAQNPFAK